MLKRYVCSMFEICWVKWWRAANNSFDWNAHLEEGLSWWRWRWLTLLFRFISNYLFILFTYLKELTPFNQSKSKCWSKFHINSYHLKIIKLFLYLYQLISFNNDHCFIKLAMILIIILCMVHANIAPWLYYFINEWVVVEVPSARTSNQQKTSWTQTQIRSYW